MIFCYCAATIMTARNVKLSLNIIHVSYTQVAPGHLDAYQMKFYIVISPDWSNISVLDLSPITLTLWLIEPVNNLCILTCCHVNLHTSVFYVHSVSIAPDRKQLFFTVWRVSPKIGLLELWNFVWIKYTWGYVNVCTRVFCHTFKTTWQSYCYWFINC